MSLSLRALLSRVIDYAGCFPPARLSLAAALECYRRHVASPEAFMLGRFVWAAGSLEQVAALWPPEAGCLGTSVVGTGGPTVDAWLQALEADLARVAGARGRCTDRISVQAYEARIPGGLEPAGVARIASEALGALARHGLAGASLALEAPPAGGEAGGLEAVADGLASASRPVAFKLRCGGPSASDVPSPGQVARVLVICRERGIPVKLTAGLHHPLWHREASSPTASHGFINVLVAGVLAHARRAAEDLLCRVLVEEDPAAFAFTDTHVQCGELSVGVGEVEAARSGLVLAFGSCSFDEPRDDLRALGLL